MNTKLQHIYTSSKGHEYVIVGSTTPRSRRCRVHFLETGYEYEAYTFHALNGKVKDRLAKDVYGVACIGAARVKDNRAEYNAWQAMICRCYCKTSSNYPSCGGRGVTVAPRWLNFANFLSDVKTMEGYERAKAHNDFTRLTRCCREGDASTIYSKETCMFLAPKEVCKSYKTNKYLLCAPDGTVLTTSHLSIFCRHNGLKVGTMRRAAARGSLTSSGWRIRLATD